jgi:hypothetical protein
MKMVNIQGKEIPIGSVLRNHKGEYGIVQDEIDGKVMIAWPLTREQAEYIVGGELPETYIDLIPASKPVRAEAKIGRNDPCHCGSGKKWKKCHGMVN